MSEARPFASLSSGLLARKGAAKPAMRPHAFGHVGTGGLEDLGWNDMGEQAPVVEPEHVPSSIAALTPSPRPSSAAAEDSPVREQQRAIAETLSVEEDSAGEPSEPAARSARVVPIAQRPMAARDKSAFTLRLDPDRHFRLRLACAVTGRSAQQIVTGALDEILQTIPELDALAGQLPAKAARRN